MRNQPLRCTEIVPRKQAAESQLDHWKVLPRCEDIERI